MCSAEITIFSGSIQVGFVSADRIIMDPIQGTNNSLALVEVASRYLEDANNLSMAKADLILDALKDAGSQVVALIEGLGENIDLYT